MWTSSSKYITVFCCLWAVHVMVLTAAWDVLLGKRNKLTWAMTYLGHREKCLVCLHLKIFESRGHTAVIIVILYFIGPRIQYNTYLIMMKLSFSHLWTLNMWGNQTRINLLQQVCGVSIFNGFKCKNVVEMWSCFIWNRNSFS